jgi:hypothetical protein
MYIYHIDENPNSMKSEMAASLQWTTDPPTREGWYWAIDAEDGEINLHRVFRADHGGNDKPLEVWLDQYESDNLSDYTCWLGPLPIPNKPSP